MRPDLMDAPEHDLVRRVMAAPGAVFVDVGANAGLYSLNAALSGGAGARILTIEPDPALLARSTQNLDYAIASGLIRNDLRVQCFEQAVSDFDGEAVLSMAGEEGSRGLLAAGVEQNGRTVRVTTLQSVIVRSDVPRIDLMKIDVEGHEDRVLIPFFASAERGLWPRRIIIEHLARAHWSIDCITDAETRGYAVVGQTHNNTTLALAE